MHTKEFGNGLVIFTPDVFKDNRGYFFESFNEYKYEDYLPKRSNWLLGNVPERFIQDNESCSQKYVMRGLHYQTGKHAQAKLVRVISGAVVDFALDLRKSSPTFGEMFFVYLSGENKKQFFIPRGFAHGLISMEDNTVFSYKCDRYYDKESEAGINMMDESLDIIRKAVSCYVMESGKDSILINNEDIIFSEKDKVYPLFKDAIYFS